MTFSKFLLNYPLTKSPNGNILTELKFKTQGYCNENHIIGHQPR